MTRLPALKARDVIKALRKAGFVELRQIGSHRFFKHFHTGHFTQVPIHGGKDIKRGTLKRIIGQAGLTAERFLELL